ncbi:hypothetical protein FOQG_09350 [Fusarium oxysporum f. sp. raphani 54005]|uniref:Uncharacterized protein n=6 Tax=Fusarium oxysporum species complex TaxID=171631 RepID=X0C709_FUSOX|nr:uncharacterized protein FOIG_10728 [Fusarium odoratissimum NRRL 54006]EXA45693.1 hypothetical protein FOVG_06589 [Fusarium oxysporum f. sp. pisi HDV247]EXK86988.1 hypothetical protein FOQG_09350 [Fusarium oxysporum f. sp. raphani 54005]EXL72755.1 hypothetical protein FOPG_11709 [Fusarium oxysporum f. sp. conglutinans race 2 54008]EXM22512.1 hypothetical protein FOTG_09787 [Fusarium oxysporum f. sp. vasinfectum 25433]TXC01464.1 hypothetical protein FocTR4_00008950 [Fusarium oxysporum f. sp. 
MQATRSCQGRMPPEFKNPYPRKCNTTECHYQEGITAYAYITVHRFGHSAIGHLHVPPCQVADAKRPLQIRCSVDKFHNNGCQFETLLASLNNRNNHTEISTLIVLDRNFQR